MNTRNIRAFAISAIGLAALALPGLAAQPTTIDFSAETVGAEPKSLVPVVGIWRIENDNGKKVLTVDGRQWKEGQSSAGLAPEGRGAYGGSLREFLRRALAHPCFP